MLEPEIETDIYFFRLFKAYMLFLHKDYSKASNELDLLMEGVNYKKSPLIEIQAKLFLGVNFLLAGKPELTENALRSLTRKFNAEEVLAKYNGCTQMVKFLKTAITNMSSGKEAKIKEEYGSFMAVTKDRFSILPFLQFTNDQLTQIGKS